MNAVKQAFLMTRGDMGASLKMQTIKSSILLMTHNILKTIKMLYNAKHKFIKFTNLVPAIPALILQ